jgi:hypothetical protein
MPLARAQLESLLRTHKLDGTLTSALPDPALISTDDEYVVAPSGITRLDATLSGGFPRGQISELVGPRSSGRTSLVLQLLAAATRRGELTAIVDALDMLDVASAEAAGIDLDRLLWIRGSIFDAQARALDHAIKALTLVLQAGNFGLVVFDVADAPPLALRRLPFTTWLRVQRIIEGSQTTCLLVGREPVARGPAGITLQLGLRAQGQGLARFSGRLFDGLDVDARVVRARAASTHVRVPLSTRAS